MNPQPKPTARLKQRKPLKRSRIRRGPSKRQRGKTPLEKRFCRWLHTQLCVLDPLYLRLSATRHVCDGPIQQAHVRDHTGASLKPSEFESFPACRLLHDRFDGRDPKGEFQGWSYEQRKTWGLARAIEARFAFTIATGLELPL